MFVNIGDMHIEAADDANIPVVCFINEPDSDNEMWTWTAINFMPRKERCGGSYEIAAKTKAEILEAVNKYVTPLYDVAAKNLRTTGKNYYWEAAEEVEKKSPLAFC